MPGTRSVRARSATALIALAARRRAVVIVVGLFGLGGLLAQSVLGDPAPGAKNERGHVIAAPASASRVSTATKARQTGPIGFGTPTVLSRTPPGGVVDDAIVAVSPTGSTAVMWREASGFDRGQTYRADYMVSLGPDASHLSSPRPIAAARTAAKLTGDSQLLAQPGGGFVACFTESGRRHGTATSGCAFAAPGHRFGPLRVVERKPWGKQSTMVAAIRADGTVLLLLSRSAGKARRSITLSALASTGQLTTMQGLGEVRGSYVPDLATLTDGTVAIAWSNGPAEDFEGGRKPVLRLMAPGSTQFGAPVAFTADQEVGAGVGVTGGAALLIDYSTGSPTDGAEQRIVRRFADGTFAPPKTLPRPGNGFLSGYAFPLLDGTPLAITSSDMQSESDCGNSTGGFVGAGPLVDLPPPGAKRGDATNGPITTERLSDPKQIAQSPSAALLGDGTVIVAWGDSFGTSGQSRIEVTTRRPAATAFSAPQVLPRDTVYGGQTLAAGGDQALLAWTVGGKASRKEDLVVARKDIVVSALRTAPPFATQQPRPAKPGTSCS